MISSPDMFTSGSRLTPTIEIASKRHMDQIRDRLHFLTYRIYTLKQAHNYST